MATINQLFTSSFKGIFENSIRLVFVPEGYRASDEAQFYQDLSALIERLSNTFPLSLLQATGNTRLSCYYSFVPSANAGYASSSSGISGRTVFESYFQGGILHVSGNKINRFVDSLQFHSEASNIYDLDTAIPKGSNTMLSGAEIIRSQTLLILLLPTSNRNDIELEVIDPSTY